VAVVTAASVMTSVIVVKNVGLKMMYGSFGCATVASVMTVALL
jgi:hypothetical protein